MPSFGNSVGVRVCEHFFERITACLLYRQLTLSTDGREGAQLRSYARERETLIKLSTFYNSFNFS